jgi:uncharacterized protein (TIGR02677 family)
MQVFPAIDLKDGCCVRLFKGDYEQQTIYSDDPLQLAKDFECAGFTALHVVDLDGARDPQLREHGQLPTRGAPPRIQDRSKERASLAAHLATESVQTQAARKRLATGRETRLSELGTLDTHAFRLFLRLLGEALAAQTHPEQPVERLTADGSLRIRLEPLDAASRAHIQTDLGVFSGRDHRVLIQSV